MLQNYAAQSPGWDFMAELEADSESEVMMLNTRGSIAPTVGHVGPVSRYH